jgi:excisionase family DNA binding protein
MGKLLRVGEVAEFLGVHANTVRDYEEQGLLPCIRIGPRRERRFDEDDIKKFKEDNNKEGKGGIRK